mmetsp:Transcript_37952/g.116596  ORF Transcript_37952/g.116596 Transcript_37952/m.116596 type:complete len:210 (-) Transcript_37952:1329-1958(-)
MEGVRRGLGACAEEVEVARADRASVPKVGPRARSRVSRARDAARAPPRDAGRHWDRRPDRRDDVGAGQGGGVGAPVAHGRGERDRPDSLQRHELDRLAAARRRRPRLLDAHGLTLARRERLCAGEAAQAVQGVRGRRLLLALAARRPARQGGSEGGVAARCSGAAGGRRHSGVGFPRRHVARLLQQRIQPQDADGGADALHADALQVPV